MALDSLKNACEKLRVDYHRFFHVGQGRSFPQNVAIQFDLSSRHIHNEHGAFVGLKFPKDNTFKLKIFSWYGEDMNSATPIILTQVKLRLKLP